MTNLFLYFLMFICILVCVAFITLFERKLLGYIQFRKGPNKTFFLGIFQPFSDAIKLFLKEFFFSFYSNKFIYLLTPIFALILMLMFWNSISFLKNQGLSNEFEILVIIVISSLSIYTILGMGWASNSKYAVLGSYRSVAQVISYEISMSFIILSMLALPSSFKTNFLMNFQSYCSFFWGYLLLLLMWMMIIMAETNRTPFDFAESESELVSGFNIEYGGFEFAIIFMAEYGNIIFMSYLTALLFFGGVGVFMYKSMFFIIIFLWIRGTLPRIRYDNLMMLAWKIFLPNSILLFFMIFLLKFNFCSFYG